MLFYPRTGAPVKGDVLRMQPNYAGVMWARAHEVEPGAMGPAPVIRCCGRLVDLSYGHATGAEGVPGLGRLLGE